nr:retrovirus-related Pol polyprotein from transposon TNT 1-94 [Tanacetum cinerariifolium]
MYNKKNIDFVALLWEDFMFQADNREISSVRKEHMSYPRFMKVIINHFISKDKTISMWNRINLHIICDDTLLSTLKFVSKTQDYQLYGTLIPNEMVNQDIKDSKAYNTYLDFTTRKATPKKARKFKKVASPSRKLSPDLQRSLSDGVGSQPKVPDEQEDMTTDSGDDESNDDDNDEVTKDEDDDDVDSDADKEANDSEKTDSDKDENPNLNQNIDEEEEHEEECVLLLIALNSLMMMKNNEVVSMMNIKVRHEEPSTQTPPLLNIHVTRDREDKDKDEDPPAGLDQRLKKRKTSAQEHIDLYNALVKAYKLDKDLCESYGNIYSLKRDREDKDKDEDPPAGLDQRLKKRKTKEPVFKAADIELLLNQGDELGNTDDQPNVEAASRDDWFKKPKKPSTPDSDWNITKTIDFRPPQTWINKIAKPGKPPLTFNELMSTPINFSAYVLKHQSDTKVFTMTMEILLEPTSNKLCCSKEKVVVSSNSEGSGADNFSELKNITGLLAKAFNRRKFYSKPTNNNLRTSSTSQSADKKQEFVKSDDKNVEKKEDEKKHDMSRVKCYNCKKEGHFAKDCKKSKDQAWMESSSDSDQEINANMVFMAQIKKVLSDSETSSSSADERISEKRIEKANQQSKDFENQNMDLQDKYNVDKSNEEKTIIDLEDKVVSLLEKKENLKTIESLKSKGFESSENAICELENKSENDYHVVEKECDKVENSKHMTVNRALLTNFVEKFLGMVRFCNNDFTVIAGYGNVVIDFLTDDRPSNLYTIALKEVASNSLTCLLEKASSSQSWLWHQCLSHLNIAIINNLVKNNFVQGLPKMKFEKDHLCSECEQGKIHRKHHKFKKGFASSKRLYLLHMDLCGSMRVQSINGKRYLLVVVDDYSRYTWRIRTDNATEIKNKTLAKFFDEVGISQQFSAARTPQQNGIVERRNRTLVEAARTMLTFANLPLFIWAEAITTACFTQNRSIIRKRFVKTPYELMNKRKPNIKFFRVFRCRCYLLNDEDVGKLKAKRDIGVFVGYSKESAAFRIYNKQTRKIQESVNVNFDEISKMASKQFNLKPGLSNLNETVKSSILSVSQVSETLKKYLEDLFHNFYDEYFDSSKIMKSSITNVETSINKEVFHEVSESFQGESSSSSLNDDVQQSPKEVILPQINTQSISNNIIPNVDEASTSHNVSNERLEDATFDASTSFHDPSIEPANVAKSLRDADWVSAMQEELDQFARLKV